MQIPKLQSVFWALVCLLFLKVFVSILAGYGDYLPPNFHRGFLTGRSEYFFGIYQIAFYSHIIVGPVALVIGTLLFLSGKKSHGWLTKCIDHTRLGRLQAIVVLFGVVPSGMVMGSPYYVGLSAGCGLMAQTIATGIAMMIAVLCAIKNDFKSHQAWATRCFMLLLSPLILRIANGTLIAFDLQSDWIMAFNNWTSWIVPLFAFEIVRVFSKQGIPDYTQNPASRTHQSPAMKGVS